MTDMSAIGWSRGRRGRAKGWSRARIPRSVDYAPR